MPSTGPERGPDRQFFPASDSARQLQVRHIRARDQQDAADGSEQQVKKMSIFADGEL